MKLTTAKKEHICNGCGKGIEYNEKYWAMPYKTLCVECYGAKLQNDSQSYKEGDPCIYCGKSSIGQLIGKSVCLEHIGDAVTTLTEDDTVDKNKGESDV